MTRKRLFSRAVSSHFRRDVLAYPLIHPPGVGGIFLRACLECVFYGARGVACYSWCDVCHTLLMLCVRLQGVGAGRTSGAFPCALPGVALIRGRFPRGVSVLTRGRTPVRFRYASRVGAYSRHFRGVRAPPVRVLSPRSALSHTFRAGALSAPAYSPCVQDCKGAPGVFPYGSRRVYSRGGVYTHSPGALDVLMSATGARAQCLPRAPVARVAGAPTMCPGYHGCITCTTSRLSLTLETDSSVLVL